MEKIALAVPREEAARLLLSIPHRSCQRALKHKHFQVDRANNVVPQSVHWLYCWGKTGMNSDRVARVARAVFTKILTVSFPDFDVVADHEESRRLRYTVGNIDADMDQLLQRMYQPLSAEEWLELLGAEEDDGPESLI